MPSNILHIAYRLAAKFSQTTGTSYPGRLRLDSGQLRKHKYENLHALKRWSPIGGAANGIPKNSFTSRPRIGGHCDHV